MNYKIIVIVGVFVILMSILYINFGQLIGGGPVCDSDENLEECLKNSPTYSIDGFPYTEFVFYQDFLFLIIPASVIIVWLIVRNKLKK